MDFCHGEIESELLRQKVRMLKLFSDFSYKKGFKREAHGRSGGGHGPNGYQGGTKKLLMRKIMPPTPVGNWSDPRLAAPLN